MYLCTKSFRKIALTSLSMLMLEACSSVQSDTLLTDLKSDIQTASPSNVDQDLEQLGKLADKAPSRAALVEDIRLVLLSRKFEQQGELANAKTHWRRAVALASGKVGQIAFNGYVKNILNSVGTKSETQVLSKLILAEIEPVKNGPFIMERQLMSEDRLQKYLRENFAANLTDPADPDLNVDIDPATDPLFTERAKIFCKDRETPQLQKWRSSLRDQGQITYFEGLVAQCRGKTQTAIDLFTKAKTNLMISSWVTHPFIFESLSRLIALRRSLGERDTVAPLYFELMERYENKHINAQTLGLTDAKFFERRIDDTLWAARYRAIQGDLENAKIFAQRGIDLIATALIETESPSPEFRDQMLIYKTEAQHFLAFRVAVEQKDYLRASAINTMALQASSLPEEWKNRLEWNGGLYEYLAGNYQTARMRWESLLNTVKDDSYRPMLYYWLARTMLALKLVDESEFYVKLLLKEYPFSYYSVVAVKQSNIHITDEDWLAEALTAEEGRKFSFDFTNDVKDEVLKKLLKRADALVAFNLNEWAGYALDEVEKQAAVLNVYESNLKLGVLVSRLNYRAGNYLKTIAQTTQLAKQPGFWTKYPEQPTFYFPLAYQQLYREASNRHGVSSSILQAISRQESGFNPTLKSGANAIGLMQMLPSTAKRFSPELAFDNRVEEKLRDPLVNISSGARFYRSLMSKYQDFYPATFSAYNAGDYVTDGWIARRNQTDPMVFVELIPYNETRSYVKNVWRNLVVYQTLTATR